MATKKPQDPNTTTDEKSKRTRNKPKEQAVEPVEPVEIPEPAPVEIPEPAPVEDTEDEPAESPEDAAAVEEILRDTSGDTEDEPAEDAEPSGEPSEPIGEAAVRAELMAMDRRDLGRMYRKAVRRKLKPSTNQHKAVDAILRQMARQG